MAGFYIVGDEEVYRWGRNKRDAHKARAAKFREKANALFENGKKGSNLYPAAKLTKFASDMIARKRAKATELLKAARRDGNAGDDEPSADYLPPIISKPRKVKTPESLEKCAA